MSGDARTSSSKGAKRTRARQEVVGDRYQVLKRLGRGGMGTVYLVSDLFAGGRRVALKRVRQDRLDPKTLAILVNEFHSLAALRHPNLAEAYDFGVDRESDDVYFTIEYVDGPHWQKVARKLDLSEGTDLQLLLDLLVQVLRALGFVHDRGLVHADIKPENILISGLKPAPDGSARELAAKLIDFGLTKRERAFGGKKIVGTTYYIAPETIRGARIDRRADLYSLGVVLYHLATGVLPFRGSSNLAVFKGHLEERPVPPHEVSPQVPLQLSQIILRLMEKRPSDRFSNAFEVIRDINREFGKQYELETAATRRAYLDVIQRGGRDEEVQRLRAIFAHVTGTEVLGGDVGTELNEISADAEWVELRQNVSSIVPTGQMVILRGERGLGKRQLIDRLRCRIETHGAAVLEVECDPERAPERSGFPELVRLVGLICGVATGQEAPEAVVRAQALGADPAGHGSEERTAIVTELVALVVRAAAERPLLLHLHDLHRADATVSVFVDRLVAKLAAMNAGAARILVTASALDHRETDDTQLARLLDASLFRRAILEVRPERLDAEKVRRLVATTLAPNELGEDLHRQLYEESDGNPAILVDLLEHLLERGSIVRLASGWRLADGYDGAPVPGRMRTELQSRIAALPRDGLGLAIAFAYLGRTGELEVAKELAGIGEARVEESLETLRRERILEETVEGVRDREWSFVHSAARELLYAMLPEAQRDAVHDRAGGLYERFWGTEADRHPRRLAFHYLRGRNREKGVRYGVAAAAEYAREFRPREAIGIYEQVLARVATGEEATRDAAREELAALLFQVGDHESVVATLAPLCGLKGAVTSPRSAIRLAQSLAYLGRFDEASQQLRRVLVEGDAPCPSDFAASALLACANLHASKGNTVESLRCADRVLADLPNLRDEGVVARLYLLLAESHYRLENASMAARYCQDALRVLDARTGEETPDVQLYGLGLFYKYKGKLAKAIGQLRQCCELARKAGVHERQAHCLLEIGNAYRLLEQPRDALEPLEQACVLLERCGNVPFLVEARCSLGEVHHLIGENEEATRLLETALDAASRLGNRQAETRIVLAFASMRLDQGDLDTAESQLFEVAARDTRNSTSATLRSIQLRFSMASARGRFGEALDLATEGLALCREGESRMFSTWLATQKALLLCRLGSRVEARRHVVRLLDIAQAHDFPLAEGRARLIEGVVGTVEGKLRAAEKAFQSANEIFGETNSERDLVQLQLWHGLLALKLGELEDVYLHFEEGIYLAKKLDLDYMKAQYQYALGMLELALPEGRVERAEERFIYAESLAGKVPYIELLWQIQYHIGRLCQLTGREAQGATFLKRASSARKKTLDGMPVSLRQSYLKAVDDVDFDRLLELKTTSAKPVEDALTPA